MFFDILDSPNIWLINASRLSYDEQIVRLLLARFDVVIDEEAWFTANATHDSISGREAIKCYETSLNSAPNGRSYMWPGLSCRKRPTLSLSMRFLISGRHVTSLLDLYAMFAVDFHGSSVLRRARRTKYQFVSDLFRERARVCVATGGETRNVNLIYTTLSHGVKSR